MTEPIPIQVYHPGPWLAVHARLPGVRAEDLRITLTCDHLTIEAAAPEGTRRASFALSSLVDDRRATILFARGVLVLYAPKLPRVARLAEVRG